MSILKSTKFKIFTLSIILFTSVCSAQASCLGKKFNMKILEETPLIDVLTQLSDMCEFSIIAKDTLSKQELRESTHGVNIKNMSLNEVFNLLLHEKNLSYEFSNNVLKISSLQTKIFKLDYITSVREGTAITKASVDSAPVEVGESSGSSQSLNDSQSADNLIKTTEKFDFWEKLDAELKAILNNTSEHIIAPDPIINQNAGLITITGTPSQIKRVQTYIDEMQKRLKKQVIIDVSIIAVDLKNEYKKGVDWSKFELGFNSYIGNNPSNGASGAGWTNRGNGLSAGFGQTLNIAANLNFSLDGIINFLETNGRTKVISSPKVTTLNNQQALISVGDNVNYRVMEETSNNNVNSDRTTVTYKQYSVFIGILLNLLPEVSDNNKIMLRVNPSLSTFKYSEDDTRTQNSTIREIAPDTIQKKLSTVVHVNSGDTIVLGGLIGQTKGKDNSEVPILSSIPLIGNAFKSTKDVSKTTELIFVITPRVVDLNDPAPISQSLKDLGFSKTLYEQ
ncbi:pilus (MSHA type) biogenesis protein MshL [Campylobacter sp. RM9344]|uniref:Pilus (MSHA type) biogenesis protein MshL n=1 Tax=Campylobacter californiensis TaxID=1032243 RepID=A0AAW3ZXF9_9BACT|nr:MULTISPECIES: pilus (MSHA type) biogenesis protein MshL [unclassified Campylobacter]MBE2984206.1 pilus (MSHA type) biogenesis protein MshL [Campylobacter sp. RM6883]MBE2986038.1 pilus (MSHA type) biogenesis protein MshL [Campylobacter sp. RM12919]MBE2988282.1 pilus (MSHA type) biogenesis protein MshL [Campylobacter sp. RM12920]MBE2994927.1 pilus (MSHA type) biogenesis protein MshL [Campylobacter sp. RM6913]MBE3029435.1 pilus (MSHA type) biogenesis protein MshL [Campylobacter sp. RM9344]